MDYHTLSMLLCLLLGSLIGMLLGGLWMQRVVRLNAEHMIRHDFRLSSFAKARLIAGLRHCPVALVHEEMHQERIARSAKN